MDNEIIYVFESIGHKDYDGANVADVAEAIFTSAVCTLFGNRGRKVTANEVLHIVELVSKNKGTTVWKIEDAGGGVFDELRCRIKLPDLALQVCNNILAYKDKKDLAEIIKASVDFVNNDRRINSYSKILFSNGKKDMIEVYADGTLNQKGTKIDVFVIINGEHTKANVSLKVGSNKLGNFDRGSPLDFERHFGGFFNEFLEIPIPSNLKKDYNNLVAEYQRVSEYEKFLSKDRKDERILTALKGLRAGVSLMINNASSILNQKFKTDQYKELFIRKIITFASKNDKTMSLLDLKSGSRSRFDEKLVSKLIGAEFHVKVKSSDTAATLIFSADGKEIVQIRPQIQTNFSKNMEVKPRIIWVMETLPAIKEYVKSRH